MSESQTDRQTDRQIRYLHRCILPVFAQLLIAPAGSSSCRKVLLLAAISCNRVFVGLEFDCRAHGVDDRFGV